MIVCLVFVIMVLALIKLMVIHVHVSLATMEQIVKSTSMNAVVSNLRFIYLMIINLPRGHSYVFLCKDVPPNRVPFSHSETGRHISIASSMTVSIFILTDQVP